MRAPTEKIKAILAFTVIILSIIYFFAITFLPNTADPQIIIAIVGMNSLIIGYYFGSSEDSVRKAETIAGIATKQTTKVTQDKSGLDVEVASEKSEQPEKEVKVGKK